MLLDFPYIGAFSATFLFFSIPVLVVWEIIKAFRKVKRKRESEHFWQEEKIYWQKQKAFMAQIEAERKEREEEERRREEKRQQWEAQRDKLRAAIDSASGPKERDAAYDRYSAFLREP